MTEDQKKKSELDQQRIEEGKNVKPKLFAKPKWHFVVPLNRIDGIKLETYGNGGIERLGIRGLLDEDSSVMDLGAMLKMIAKEKSSSKKEKATPAEKK